MKRWIVKTAGSSTFLAVSCAKVLYINKKKKKKKKKKRKRKRKRKKKKKKKKKNFI